jgi:hypothetical protein
MLYTMPTCMMNVVNADVLAICDRKSFALRLFAGVQGRAFVTRKEGTRIFVNCSASLFLYSLYQTIIDV